VIGFFRCGFLGRFDVWRQRLQSYLGFVNFLMILYLYLSSSPFGVGWWFWVLGFGIGAPVLIVLDILFVYPHVLNYSFSKNPGFMGLRRDLDEVNVKLDLLLNELKK